MQFKYLLHNDSNVNDKTHLQFFENIQDCNMYMLENNKYYYPGQRFCFSKQIWEICRCCEHN